MAHRDVGVRPAVPALELLVLVLRAGALDGLVVARDPLDAGGDVGVALAGGNGVGRLADRLEAGGAVARDGRAVHAHGQLLREEHHDAGQVESLQPLRQADAAVELLDLCRVDLGVALEQRVHDERAHLVRAELGQRALEGPADGRANGVHDHW
jgi:hypothetical protein